MQCAKCGVTIVDQFVMRVDDDQYYHAACLICSVCEERLMTKCFVRDDKLYCALHFHRCEFFVLIHAQKRDLSTKRLQKR